MDWVRHRQGHFGMQQRCEPTMPSMKGDQGDLETCGFSDDATVDVDYMAQAHLSSVKQKLGQAEERFEKTCADWANFDTNFVSLMVAQRASQDQLRQTLNEARGLLEKGPWQGSWVVDGINKDPATAKSQSRSRAVNFESSATAEQDTGAATTPAGGLTAPKRILSQRNANCADSLVSWSQSDDSNDAAPERERSQPILPQTRSSRSTRNSVSTAVSASTSSTSGVSRVPRFSCSLLEHQTRRVTRRPQEEEEEEADEDDDGKDDDDKPPQHRWSWLQVQHVHGHCHLTGMQLFETFSFLIILVNVLLIGLETNYMTSHENKTSTELFVMQLVLNVWYLCELVFRICYYRLDFCRPGTGDFAWNVFDIMMATFSVVDIIAAMQARVAGIDFKVIRIVRLIRITRAIRIGRLLKHLRQLHKMAFSLAYSVPTLVWSLVLLLFLVYAFGICLTQAVSDYLHNDLNGNVALLPEGMIEYYGTLSESIYTLYLSVTNGVSWGLAVKPLFELHWSLVALFLLYVSITLLGVMNIVTSVFVESAMQSIAMSRELMVEEKALGKAMYVNHLKQIFRQIDTDGSGTISEVELKEFLDDHALGLHSYFEALELNATDVDALFQLLDTDGSGSVDIDEFCDGCMNLKGEAKSYDIKLLMHEVLSIQKNLSLFIKRVDLSLSEVHSQVHQNFGLDDVRRSCVPIAALPEIGARAAPPASLDLSIEV
eukprot:TRINITY_DN24983_c1_g2_i1.p1 TRINITY_DN24983_c1_g2~~TRINITY_DN24983_c1_g2_i1.p1  ORF type:complete len:715 (+),score=157.22 TRINITY_DN24983_c1_g2_i1:111-2255(+)